MAKLKTFEQFMDDRDRADEIEKEVVDLGTADSKGAEEAEEEAEEVQGHGEESEVEVEEIEEGNAFGDAVRKAKEDGEKEFEFEGKTYKVEEAEETESVEETKEDDEEFHESTETEEVVEDTAKAQAQKAMVANLLSEAYESCKSEAKAYEDDAHDEHTIESYMKENAALIAALAAGSLKEMKEDYAVEAYESACNEMVEAYTKKMNEMKESFSAGDAEDSE